MGKKMRPGSQGNVLGREAASLRRGAPGKRFIGETADQSRQAKQQEVARATELAAEAADERRREALREESIAGILFGLAVESYRLARSFVLAPFRIAGAVRRTRAESGA